MKNMRDKVWVLPRQYADSKCFAHDVIIDSVFFHFQEFLVYMGSVDPCNHDVFSRYTNEGL